MPGVSLHWALAPSAAQQPVQRYRKAAQEAFANGRFERYVDKFLSELQP